MKSRVKPGKAERLLTFDALRTAHPFINMIHFICTCGNTLFFENTLCLKCGSTVGYDPADNAMKPVTQAFAQCRNGTEFGVCNWLVPAAGQEYCAACLLNHIVPDLSVAGNMEAWHKMEIGKRRAIYTLARLGIMPADRTHHPDGLAFDFLTPIPELCVVTGHKDGIITLNLNEADDLYRERQRHHLGEPYRTLIGHFRHELGHYYWDRFFSWRTDDDPLRAEFRALFGDERDDYEKALARYYANGPLATWPSSHITGYASAHPWEDWAETWAQYLHIVDGVETAGAFGWESTSVPIPFTPFLPEQMQADTQGEDDSFLNTLNDWARLSPALNEMAASLGHTAMYPFIFTQQTARKILFVHRMLNVAAQSWAQQVTTPPTPAPTPLQPDTPSAPPVTPPPLPVTTPPPPLTTPQVTKPMTGMAAA
jgi:hypothetical protein